MNKTLFIIVLAILLQACNTVKPIDVSSVRKKTVAHDPFLETLRMGYLEFYDYEISKKNFKKANTYGRKALVTTQSLAPDMENLFDKEIPIARLNGLLGSKYFLEAAFVNGTKEMIPEESARAQLMFDCWSDQEDVRAQKEIKGQDVLPCQDEFNKVRGRIKDALAEIRRIEKQKETARIEAEKRKMEAYHKLVLSKALAEQKKMLKQLPEYSLLFFKFDSTKLGITAKSILDKVAKDIDLFNPRKVILRGNTDLVGSDEYNMKLALARGQAAADYLINEHGVDAKLLDVKAYGENKPRENPGKINKDVRNRYVQITFEFDNKFYPGMR
ncbi:MAG: OmpA family protein [Rickettsiales bacterium]|nr:OmpA family protein [Pseudomonadota bacterium]MDA0965705.1 OmpA family protein [Pseudomonadota bacterium]MDG4543833.1 OmpA family protein [Rickettsiales bacterium]MDG4545980.1 OmpA family protein [Rickettsiales bacterium]MDG4548226.1 OmpA family protein [Rickettsiales bacterium]